MKTNILLTFFITVIIFTHYKSQTSQPINITDYPNFYNQTVSKLNNLMPNKTNYYNQPLSVFLQALDQNNIAIKAYDPGPFDNNFLTLMFINDAESSSVIYQNGYVQPHIAITFQQPFDFQQATTILNQYHWFWNSTVENFYKNLVIKKIEFWYVRGLTNKAQAPK
ncbi:Uncharacterised protein [Chryseobacterium gleum]|uniref:Uncharacterized protein n=2 Tax=Chryseobacterium gleum TaxID=250 RepID=A0A448B6F2_CHRGE|nr:hypothetical protein [Chryseobacterium gleum]EFK37939.1 hypothetical protein HMPREF0204_10712 [Chryseobacterium gleum ATCC 35910]QBJ87669.1 hypothetical protein DDI74_15960 [Chryseobacterium gleum]QQY32605.1 hypothetical protein I6I60_02080 [Chryseobacterium gleum]VEE10175.1 Uncharacterised protein [Chryseobacterium gleum]